VTFVGVEVGAGRAKLRLRGGNLAPRVISQNATGAKVALVATTALLLGGDHVDLELDVGPGAWLEIVETAGMVAYDSAGALSNWRVSATVADDGLLLWHGEPFVVAGGANTLRSSSFDLGRDAGLCLRETVVLGRTGESGGAVRIRNQVRNRSGPVLVEELNLTEIATRELPGLLGPATVVDTVTLIGIPSPSVPALPEGCAFDLDEAAGTIGRVLRTGFAGSPASTWWSAWSAAARETHRLATEGTEGTEGTDGTEQQRDTVRPRPTISVS
jgi:urease accessory protein